ncbi:hypothetical protein ACFQ9J_36485, partial [Streptomyces sp. NPDC056529]|uniref:hypothetical protein n=1 Tax=Streptomyces sp. NPDC056529 TaxID=3345855 RepID=UPI00368CB38F
SPIARIGDFAVAVRGRAAQAVRYLQHALTGTGMSRPRYAAEVMREIRPDQPGHRRGDTDTEILLYTAGPDQLKPGAGNRTPSDGFGSHLRAEAQTPGPQAMRLPVALHENAGRPGADGEQACEGE